MRAATVVVVGPPLSGAGAVASALQDRLDGCQVTESSAGHPDVVVFVVSAAAPLTQCDVVLLEEVAAATDAVVGVVTKIDVHRTWREVLETNRTALAGHASRYRATPWVGAAAEPQIGAPVIEPLVVAVAAALGDSGRIQRNRLRSAQVRAERSRQRDLLRAEVRNTRLELAAGVRAAVVALRAELQQRAARASRREIAGFDEQVRRRVTEASHAVEDLVRARFAQLCRSRALPAPVIAAPPDVWDGLPPPHRAAADQVAVMFAATFGVGVALTLGRFAELVVGASPWALGGSGAVGLALTLWVARARRLAAARTAADRWVAEVAAGLRSALEDRVLAAESSLLATLAEHTRTPN